MGDNSKIAWTDATWNPIVGCTKVSEGCRNCYAFSLHEKRHKAFQEGKLQNIPQYAQPFSKIQLLEDRLQQPLKWKRPRKIFVNSLSDLFHEDVPFSFVKEVFKVMTNSVHTFQILTKRPERMLDFFNQNPMHPLSNVWLGVTVENQEQADKRIPILRQVPAAIRFLSIEPMLGPIDLLKFHYHEGDSLEMKLPFDLVICGGESGPNARPLHPDNARSLRDQCVAAGVKFFFKQWGEYYTKWINGQSKMPEFKFYESCQQFTQKYWVYKNDVCVDMNGNVLRNGGDFQTARYPVAILSKVGTKKAGCLLDGREWKELPEPANYWEGH